MGQEILYTSAPQGLRQGSSGFCTVGSTAGMEPNLAQFLEGFSGYPHPYKPPDPRTKDNPVNYSFIQWTIGGQRYYVLSRVCDAGLDHTGRTNLLAHHVALTRREIDRLPGGPAYVMAAGDFFITTWDKQLRTLAGQKPRGGDSPLACCEAWKRAAGDAGYAGVLAEAAKEKGGRPVSVIYPAGTDVLALVAEAQSLLPPERRWNVTFATLYSRIYSSFEVQWKFLFHETTEAKQARRDPHALVIDLCNGNLPQAQGGDLVTAARDGQFVTRAPQTIAAREAPTPGRGRRPPVPSQVIAVEGDLTLAPPEDLPEGAGVAAGVKTNPFSRARRRSVWLHYALAGAAGGILAIVAFLLLVVFGPKPEPPIAGLPPAGGGPDTSVPTLPVAATPVVQPDVVPEPVATTPSSDPDASNPPPNPTPEPTPAISSSIPTAPRPMPPPASAKDPFEDILHNKKLKLILPQRPGAGGLTAGSGGASPHLADVYVQSAAELNLQLLGKEAVFGPEAARVKVEREDKGGASTWRIVKEPAGPLGKKEELGAFKLEGQKLSFQWNRSVQPGAKPDALRHCVLEVNIGGKRQVCQLSEPIRKEGLKLAELQAGAQTIELTELDSATQSLKLEVQPVDLPAPFVKLPKDEALSPDTEQRILIKGGSAGEGPRIELTVKFASDPQRPQRRLIQVSAKATYRTSDISEEDALKSVGGPLEMKRIAAGVREYTDKADRVDLNVKRLQTRLDEHKKAAEREDKGIDVAAKSLRSQLAVADGAQKEETKRELDALMKRKAAFEKKRDEQRATLLDGLKQETEERNKFKQMATRFESLGQLMSDTAAKGRLEFRIYFQIDGQVVELYRSQGFPQEL